METSYNNLSQEKHISRKLTGPTPQEAVNSS